MGRAGFTAGSESKDCYDCFRNRYVIVALRNQDRISGRYTGRDNAGNLLLNPHETVRYLGNNKIGILVEDDCFISKEEVAVVKPTTK